eukprot:TRINITY_DN78504_c0_g1_i1.p1 TRINITY_DN78504_c0_g1~~TRINITY_DN78504_c0_g1_i1.p1  ORF type:complete len:233 (+),score=15.53 TRINITY_DN78504_c0_g1_i1:54-701(+)
MAPSLAPFEHPTLPSLRYYDHFITRSQELQLLHDINSHHTAWKLLHNRALQNWGGLPHIRGMLPTPLPPFLQPLIRQLTEAHIFDSPPNHVLVNRYLPGQGIHAHEDGPAYKSLAAIISLQSPIVMQFYHTAQTGGIGAHAASMLLRPRSLLVMCGHVYEHMLHAIAESYVDNIDQCVLNASQQERGTSISRAERISLTVRTSCRTLRNPLGRKR